MGHYMGQRIIDGAFTYDEVMAKRPDLKPGVEEYLKMKERTDLIAPKLEV